MQNDIQRDRRKPTFSSSSIQLYKADENYTHIFILVQEFHY